MADTVQGVDGFIDAARHIFEQGMHADYTPVLRDIMNDLENRHGGLFDFESSPMGDKWPELAESTIAMKGHDQILYRSGRLRASLEGETGDSVREIITDTETPGFSFGTSVPYAGKHQFGLEGLDVREHVGANDNMVDEMTEKIADHIVGTMVLGPIS